MINKYKNPRVAVDPEVEQENPTVAVTQISEETEKKESSSNISVSFVQRIANLFMDFLETIVVAASIFVVVYLFLVQPHEVIGSSMEPSFFSSEYILTDKISYRFTDPKRGDVIIFQSPTKPNVDFIKRIIGLPGEKVKIEKGQVFINGKKLKEDYLNDPTPPGAFMKEGREITLRENEYFVMGDNRPSSSDSRDFGPIRREKIRGQAKLIYWPVSKLGIIAEVKY